MFKLIRYQLMDEEDWPKLKGTVEVDEMFVGGKGRGKGRAMKNRNKTPVIGIVERGGKVRAFALPDASAASLLPHIHDHIHAGSTVYTDEYTSYRTLGKLGYDHHMVKHGARIYVEGDIHTNTVENLFWNIRRPSRDVSLRQPEVPTGVLERVHVQAESSGRCGADVQDDAQKGCYSPLKWRKRAGPTARFLDSQTRLDPGWFCPER
jgi:transposase-like protein